MATEGRLAGKGRSMEVEKGVDFINVSYDVDWPYGTSSDILSARANGCRVKMMLSLVRWRSGCSYIDLIVTSRWW